MSNPTTPSPALTKEEQEALPSCPFCGCNNLRMTKQTLEGVDEYFVRCRRFGCLAEGPPCVDESAALQKWRERSDAHNAKRAEDAETTEAAINHMFSDAPDASSILMTNLMRRWTQPQLESLTARLLDYTECGKALRERVETVEADARCLRVVCRSAAGVFKVWTETLTEAALPATPAEGGESVTSPGQVFDAVCGVCRRNPELISWRTKQDMLRLARWLEREGYRDSDVKRFGELWHGATAPTPRQVQDCIKEVLASAPEAAAGELPEGMRWKREFVGNYRLLDADGKPHAYCRFVDDTDALAAAALALDGKGGGEPAAV